jgi:hypothetical protein
MIAENRPLLSLLTIPALGVLFSCAAIEPTALPVAEAELSIVPGPYSQYQQAPRPTARVPRHQHAMMLIGSRLLDDSAWKGMGEQFGMGFTFDKQLGESGLALDGGLHFSGDSTTRFVGSPPINTKLTSDVFEIDLGLMKMFYPGQPGEPGLRPYLGAGLAISWVSARMYRWYYRDDTDFTPGAYARTGLLFQHESGALFGLDLRYLGLTDVNIAGFDTNIDGWVVSFAMGYGF